MVELASGALIVGGVCALLIGVTDVLYFAASVDNPAVRIALVAVGATYSLLLGVGGIICAISARRGRSWPKWVVALLAIAALPMVVRTEFFSTLVAILLTGAAVLLWLPSARKATNQRV
ncbi:hypothetical protein [Agromyces sp. LHK192]|uniref:hypothetical protein n=1 Tax=Agromyces sp. LHK192 TaxID=2498704 RepID=UPI000FDC8E17|nr:hypothetical protein [Agromyces sp. LHK192]